MATRVQKLTRDYIRRVLATMQWTPTTLAKAIGKAPSTINRFLNDETVTHELSLDTLRRIAEVSRQPLPADLLPIDEKREAVVEPDVDLGQAREYQAGARDLPVLGRAAGGVGDHYDMTEGDVIDRIERPPVLENVGNAYALYLSGSSMEPRYFAGETIYVHPGKPITPGCFVVVQLWPENDGDPIKGLVKRFVRRTNDKLVLHQLNPPDSPPIEIPMKRVKAIHRILLGGDG